MSPPTTSPFITRVVIENYKSIAFCDVRLGPLNVLVGPNGSGKSNFLDALRFVNDACRNSLNDAIRMRGGIGEIIRRSNDVKSSFSMRFEFRLPHGMDGRYTFRIQAHATGGYGVVEEECAIDSHKDEELPLRFVMRDGGFDTNALPANARNAFSLPGDTNLLLARDWIVQGAKGFQPVSEAFRSMRFYDISPSEMRNLRSSRPADVLTSDGSNITGVLEHLVMRNEGAKERIDEYLSRIVPTVHLVQPKTIVDRSILQFRQRGEKTWEPFLALSLSNGTLRVLGILVALFQSTHNATTPTTLTAIEEPEAAVHPGALRMLFDAMREASKTTQVIATSHSPDLLDDKDIDIDSILAVTVADNETRIGHLDEVGRSVIRDQLFTVGELLRMNQVEPDATATRLADSHAALFT